MRYPPRPACSPTHHSTQSDATVACARGLGGKVRESRGHRIHKRKAGAGERRPGAISQDSRIFQNLPGAGGRRAQQAEALVCGVMWRPLPAGRAGLGAQLLRTREPPVPPPEAPLSTTAGPPKQGEEARQGELSGQRNFPSGGRKIKVRASKSLAKSLQSCPTLCDPIDGSPPRFPVPGILQARTLEWVAISFSNA